jgi:dihydrofolate reductase
MKVSLVAAVARNRVIGKNNDLPWRLPDDMKFFMNKTKGHFVVLGRKNFESLPHKYKPLPDRTNVIVTRQKDFHAPGCIVVNNMEDALATARRGGETEAMIIGGADIYSLSLPYADRLYLTEIHADVEGDVYFPEFDKNDWRQVSRVPHDQDEKHAYSFDFVLYERK